MDRILVIQTAFLGDVILATPVVSELKRLYPESSIDVLVKKGNESLIQNDPSISKVIIFDKKSGKLKSIVRLIRSFRKENYDLAINLHRFGSSGLLAGFSGAKSIIGFKKNPFSLLYNEKYEHRIGDGTHEVERNLSLIKKLGAKNSMRPSLFPSDKDFSQTEVYKSTPYYCIAPASVWFTKQLPKTKWIELIQKLERDKKVYLIGGPNDHQLCEEIRLSMDAGNIENLAGDLSLMQSAALMKDAVRNYVNDSGPLHLASAMNAPVTAFFCSTIADFGFGPLSVDSKVNEVKALECRPCGLHGHKECPKGHFKCGNDMPISLS